MLAKRYRLPMTSKLANSARMSGQYISLVLKPNHLTHSRAAVIVSKKCSPKAVVRNLIKRRLTHIVKAHLHTSPYVDMVLIAHRGIDQQTSADLAQQLDLLYSNYRSDK